ncbi:YkvA family protein [Streptomyces geranii]|uniref:YkvA family protein n=1 Tax=Streptomyces geranii TaxID=2058923 RepID=UPI000D037D08|nr:YkvA family protein [Streptomyces geranii]
MDSTTTVIVVVAVLAVAALAVAATVLVRLVRTRRDLRRAGLPTGSRWVFWGAVLYLVLPTDLVPDPVYLDDIGVLLLALRSMRAQARERELELDAGGPVESAPGGRADRFG